MNMEDLEISPWQNYQSLTLTSFYDESRKSSSKVGTRLSIRNRFIQTESEDHGENQNFKRYINLSISRRKGQSESTHQNLYQKDQKANSNGLSKLQLKLVSYPILEKRKQRQTKERYSQKLDTHPLQNYNRTFQALQTIVQAEISKSNILKQRHLLNKPSLMSNQFRKNFLFQKENQLANKYRQKQHKYSFQFKDQCVNIHQSQSFKLDGLTNQLQNVNSETMLQKRKIDKSRFEPYFTSKNASLIDKKPNLQIQRIQKDQKASQSKIIDKANGTRMFIQKLQKIECFKDNTNVFVGLKQKNKLLFKELEKYNLFGLRNLRKISKKSD